MKLCCFLLVLFLHCAAYSQAVLQAVDEVASTTLRGLVNKQSPDGTTYPVAQVKVTLAPVGADAQTTALDAVTGLDGMFYFYKIPPGSYVLSVNNPESPSPEVRNIDVKETASYVDIQEITLTSARALSTATPRPSPGDWAYYGQRDPRNRIWSGKYFRKTTGDPDGIPEIGDVVVAQGKVYVRKGPAYRKANDYYNEDETGTFVKSGDRLKVLERRGPFPGDPPDLTYPWLYFRFERQ